MIMAILETLTSAEQTSYILPHALMAKVLDACVDDDEDSDEVLIERPKLAVAVKRDRR